MVQRETRRNSKRYKESRRQANRIVRKKKKENLKQHMEKIEELHTQNESKKMYQVKRMTKGFQPRTNACKDKEGRVIETEKKILERWVMANMRSLEKGDARRVENWSISHF